MTDIRLATSADAHGIATVQINTWRVAYKGIIPDEVLDSLDYSVSTERWQRNLTSEKIFHYVVVGALTDVIAFASGGPCRDEIVGYDGELYALYVLSEAQKKGLGRALIRSVARHLSNDGYRAMLIWVLRDNYPARCFYERMGGQLVAEKTTHIGKDLLEVGYGWMNLDAFENAHA